MMQNQDQISALNCDSKSLTGSLNLEKKVMRGKEEEVPESTPAALSIVRLNWLQARSQLSMLFIALIVLLIPILASTVKAEHALSEVWSESEGLQMKYSTDHDDLLSTRGSELQMNVHGEPSKESGTGEGGQESAGAAGGQEESSSGSEGGSSESSGPTSSDHTSDGSSGQLSSLPTSSSGGADTEPQEADSGADSTSRKTNRVPLNRKQSSSKFPEFKEESDGFNSIPSDQSSGANNNQYEGADQVNVDNGSDMPPQASQETPTPGKQPFRQIGRMFKEAVKMTKSGPEQKVKHSEKSSTSDNNNDDDEEAADGNSSNGGLENSNEKQQQEQQEDEAGADEPNFGPYKSSPGAQKTSPRGRQNMIDFDRLVDNKQGRAMLMNQNREPLTQQQAGPTADELSSLEGGEEQAGYGNPAEANDGYRRHGQRMNQIGQQQLQQLMNGPPDDFGMFQSAAPNSFFTAAGSSPAHKERAPPAASKSTTPAAGGSASSSAQAKQANNYKQLAYFRNLSQQQQKASQDARTKPAITSRAQQQEPDSPDSVRDNFISPGHFPGSMPHLTQAASEMQKKQAEVPAATSVQPIDEQKSASSPVQTTQPGLQDTTVAASTNTVSTSTTNAESSQQQKAASPQTGDTNVSSLGEQQTNKTSQADSRVEPAAAELPSKQKELPIHVTPVPEVQPESQQIMAPVYFSTTTMAPIASTSTTSEPAPTLKRFKFRKYRWRWKANKHETSRD